MAGHSRPKDGVLSHAYVPAIHVFLKTWMPGIKPGMDGKRAGRRPLRTRAQHGDRAAVLRPAGDIIANRDRPFFSVRDRAQALRLDTTRRQFDTRNLRAARTQTTILLTRTTTDVYPLHR